MVVNDASWLTLSPLVRNETQRKHITQERRNGCITLHYSTVSSVGSEKTKERERVTERRRERTNTNIEHVRQLCTDVLMCCAVLCYTEREFKRRAMLVSVQAAKWNKYEAIRSFVEKCVAGWPLLLVSLLLLVLRTAAAAARKLFDTKAHTQLKNWKWTHEHLNV